MPDRILLRAGSDGVNGLAMSQRDLPVEQYTGGASMSDRFSTDPRGHHHETADGVPACGRP